MIYFVVAAMLLCQGIVVLAAASEKAFAWWWEAEKADFYATTAGLGMVIAGCVLGIWAGVHS